MQFIRQFGFLCLAVAAATAGHSQSATATGGSAHQQMYSNISRQMSTLRNVVESGFVSVREDIRTVNSRLDGVEGRLDALEGSMSDVKERLTAIEKDVKQIGKCGGKGKLWNGEGCAAIRATGSPLGCGQHQHGSVKNAACPQGQKGEIELVCNNGFWVLQSSTCQGASSSTTDYKPCGFHPHGSIWSVSCAGGGDPEVYQCWDGTKTRVQGQCVGGPR